MQILKNSVFFPHWLGNFLLCLQVCYSIVSSDLETVLQIFDYLFFNSFKIATF